MPIGHNKFEAPAIKVQEISQQSWEPFDSNSIRQNFDASPMNEGEAIATTTPTAETKTEEPKVEVTVTTETAETKTENAVAATETATTTETTEEPKTQAEARKMFIEAANAKRKADKELKRAQDMAKKADDFQRALADTDKDPTAILKAAGLDPATYYQKLTTYALNDNKLPEETVEQKTNTIHQQVQKLQDELKRRDETQAETQVIYSQVLPVLKDADKFESLMGYCGDNPTQAAIYVYQAVKDEFERTGNIVDFAQAAEALEKYHTDQLEAGINKALKMKKFSEKYGKGTTPTTQNSETPKDKNEKNIKLSEKLSKPNAQNTNNMPSSYSSDQDERIRRVLSKFSS